MFAQVDTSEKKVKRYFSVFGTGHEIPLIEKGRLIFIGTAQTNNGLVFHAFEKLRF